MKRFRRNPLTAGRLVDGLAFIVTPDNNKLHTLNSTATHLWSFADKFVSIAEAASELESRFDITAEIAARDTEACVHDLVTRGIFVWEL